MSTCSLAWAWEQGCYSRPSEQGWAVPGNRLASPRNKSASPRSEVIDHECIAYQELFLVSQEVSKVNVEEIS